MHSIASIAPVVLAAGDSTRMGYPKALLPLGADDTFITRILKTICKVGLPRPIIILGKAAQIIQPRIRNWPGEIYVNPDPGRGQLSSIQLALSHIHSVFSSCLIWPVDQPTVSENLVRNLAQLFITSESLIAIPRCRHKRGHPAIFHRTLFQEFLGTPVEEGPKSILKRHRKAIAVMQTDELAAIQDIDTPSDYQALTGESLESALARSSDNASKYVGD